MVAMLPRRADGGPHRVGEAPVNVILAAFTGTIPVNVDTVAHGEGASCPMDEHHGGRAPGVGPLDLLVRGASVLVAIRPPPFVVLTTVRRPRSR
jgi:hypothetical protein